MTIRSAFLLMSFTAVAFGQQASLALSAVSYGNGAYVGSDVKYNSYMVTVLNTSPTESADAVTITFTLPKQTSLSFIPENCKEVRGAITCHLGELEPNVSGWINIMFLRKQARRSSVVTFYASAPNASQVATSITLPALP